MIDPAVQLMYPVVALTLSKLTLAELLFDSDHGMHDVTKAAIKMYVSKKLSEMS